MLYSVKWTGKDPHGGMLLLCEKHIPKADARSTLLIVPRHWKYP